MGRRIKIASLAILSAFTAVALTTSTLAWFAHMPDLAFGTGSGKINVNAGSETSYYESGSGDSLQDPYIISNRNHLYNLAWLQYMGRYNSPSISQKYFKLKNDIDMSGLTLPPIGTDNYPFLGHFDGNNKTVSNLVISNDDPTSSNSDFGVTKPNATTLAGTTPSKIVGFFGVVGQSPTIADLTYSSSIVSVSNLTLNNITVKSETSETLIGLAAGYVDGTMSGVKISGNATLDVDGESTTAAMSSITNHISDYGLVGYSTKTSRSGSYSQDISAYYDSEDNEGSGSNWGGSIAIDDLFDRLLAIKNDYTVRNNSFVTEKRMVCDHNGTYVRTVDTNTASAAVYEYNETTNKGTYNNKMGAFQFGDTRTDIHYLSGGHYTRKVSQYAHTGYHITDGTNYLSYDGTSLTNTTDASDIDVLSLWHFVQASGSDYYIRTNYESNSDNRYLYNNNGVLAIGTGTSTSANAVWTITQDQDGMQIVNDTYQIFFTGSQWALNDLKCYYMKSGSNYISKNSTNKTAVTNTTNSSYAAEFYVSDHSFYFLNGNTKMYLAIYYTYSTTWTGNVSDNPVYEIRAVNSLNQSNYYYLT